MTRVQTMDLRHREEGRCWRGLLARKDVLDGDGRGTTMEYQETNGTLFCDGRSGRATTRAYLSSQTTQRVRERKGRRTRDESEDWRLRTRRGRDEQAGERALLRPITLFTYRSPKHGVSRVCLCHSEIPFNCHFLFSNSHFPCESHCRRCITLIVRLALRISSSLTRALYL